MGNNLNTFKKAFCQLSPDDMKKIKIVKMNRATKQVNRIAGNDIMKTVSTIYKTSDFTDIFNELLHGVKSASIADTKTIQHAHVQHDTITALVDELEHKHESKPARCFT